MDNINVTRIDAPFPEQWREEMYAFVSELQAIRASLDVLNTNVSKSAEAEHALAKHYETGSQSDVASQAQSDGQSQKRLVDPFGNPLGASSAPNAPNARIDLGTVAAAAGLGGAGVLPTPPSGGGGPSTPSGPSAGGSGGPSQPGGPGAYARNYLDENGPFEMPQYFGGTYTVQDLLKLGAQSGSWAQDRFGIEQFGTAGDILAKGAAAMPTLSLVQQYGSQLRGYSQGMESLGGSLGYQQDSGFGVGSVDLGPLSFRPPIVNPASLQGIQQRIESFGTSLSHAGMSSAEALGLRVDLANRGWYPDQPAGEGIYDLFTSLKETNPEVYEIEGTRDLVDKATRQGTASFDEMINTLKNIPEAAKNAHISMEQMVADMDAFGEYNQSLGGTHYGGQQLAMQLSSLTGQPPGALMGFMQSPWTESTIFRETGQPSWMQGALPGPMRTRAAIQGFFDAARAVGRPEDINRKVPGTGGDLTQHVSGVSQQAEMMHQFFYPDMSPEAIQKWLRLGPDGMQRRNEVLTRADAWRQYGKGIMEDPRFSDEKRDLIMSRKVTKPGDGVYTFGDMLQYMRTAKTNDGKSLFSRDDIRGVMSAGSEARGEDRLNAKYQAIQNLLGEKSRKASDHVGGPGNTVTLDLSPAARKLLQLPNKKAQYKLQAGSGERTNVNAANVGYTDPILPTSHPPATGRFMPTPATGYNP